MVSGIALKLFWTCLLVFLALCFLDTVNKYDSDATVRAFNKTQPSTGWLPITAGLAIVIGGIALVIGLSALIWGF